MGQKTKAQPCVVTRLEVVAHTERRPVRGYLETEAMRVQTLQCVTRVCGIVVRRQVIDTEEVPAAVVIEVGALGSTSWRSRFADSGAVFTRMQR